MTDFTPQQHALIEKHRHWNVEHVEWWDYTYEQFIDALSAFGLDVEHRGHRVRNPHISFSGFWSQGDGASFATQAFTVGGLLDAGRGTLSLPDDHEKAFYKTSEQPTIKALRALYEQLEAEFGVLVLSGPAYDLLHDMHFHVEQSGHYCHSHTMQLHGEWHGEYFEDLPSDLQDLASRLEGSDLRDELQDALRAVADALYEELEAEYEHLTSDEAVWEAIEANELDTDGDLEEDDFKEAA